MEPMFCSEVTKSYSFTEEEEDEDEESTYSSQPFFSMYPENSVPETEFVVKAELVNIVKPRTCAIVPMSKYAGM